MALTPEQIKNSSDEELFKLLGQELQSKLSVSRESPEFIVELRKLPIGFRAMAATYELDVSLAMDDLGWHFGNWHSKELARETLEGLIELQATELAELFERAFEITQQYWVELGKEDWANWYHGSKLEKETVNLSERASKLVEIHDLGVFKFWVDYARKFPERLTSL